MDELKLFKLITMPDPEDSDVSYVSEYGWIDDKSFCVWIDYMWVDDFMTEPKTFSGTVCSMMELSMQICSPMVSVSTCAKLSEDI